MKIAQNSREDAHPITIVVVVGLPTRTIYGWYSVQFLHGTLYGGSVAHRAHSSPAHGGTVIDLALTVMREVADCCG